MHKTAVYKTIAYGTPKTAKLRKSDITQQPVPLAYPPPKWPILCRVGR